LADEALSSESDASTSSNGSDEDKFLVGKSTCDIIITELEFDAEVELEFSPDVYNYTICANMTKCCSPLQQGFALKQCFIVFGVQILIPTFFLFEKGINSF